MMRLPVTLFIGLVVSIAIIFAVAVSLVYLSSLL